MKTRPVGAELFHADGRTDREAERNDAAKSRFSQFCERAYKLSRKLEIRRLQEGYYVGRDVLTFLGEDGFRITTQLISNMCETGEWPKDLIKVTMFVLKKKPKGTKCTDHRTISLVTHTTKI